MLIMVLGFLTQCKQNGRSNITETTSSTQELNKISSMKDGKTSITIKSKDGLPIIADVYKVENSSKPTILLFHQAGYSRGEYLEIAPKLNALGYSCIAIDQRSGKAVNGIVNETHAAAKKANKKTEFVDAAQDLRATIEYAINELDSKEIILWGSSYSSSLVFILGNEFAEHVSAILSFAPGEYFKYDEKKIEDYSSTIDIPVFITSAKNEYKNWKAIFDRIPSKSKTNYIPEDKGHHGSKALWEKSEGHELYWKNVIDFLNKYGQ